MTTPTKKALDRARMVRWLIIHTAYNGGHLGATEGMISQVLDGQFTGEAAILDYQIRTEVAYLEDKKLVAVSRHPVDPWVITLTASGRDFFEKNSPADPGIYRPKCL